MIEDILRLQERPTHFLSLPIPLARQQLEALYSKIHAVDPAAFISAANFHITLGVLSLSDQTEIERAIDYLKEKGQMCVDDILKGEPLKVNLKQLAVMQADPVAAHVMYIEPHDDTQRLLRFCIQIIKEMIEGGFMKKENRPLKLHATIINTSHSKKGKKRIPFDAKSILEHHKHVNFGQFQLDKLHLMKMGRTGPGNTYQSEGYILLE